MDDVGTNSLSPSEQSSLNETRELANHRVDRAERQGRLGKDSKDDAFQETYLAWWTEFENSPGAIDRLSHEDSDEQKTFFQLLDSNIDRLKYQHRKRRDERELHNGIPEYVWDVLETLANDVVEMISCLDDQREREIVAMRCSGMTFDEIGTRLGVNRQAVHRIWKVAAGRIVAVINGGDQNG